MAEDYAPGICPKTGELCEWRQACVEVGEVLERSLHAVEQEMQRPRKVAGRKLLGAIGITSIWDRDERPGFNMRIDAIKDILITNCVNDVCIVENAMSTDPEFSTWGERLIQINRQAFGQGTQTTA